MDESNDSHECICFQTCDHDTRDDADNHTTRFFKLPTITKEFSSSGRRIGLKTVQALSVNLCLLLTAMKKMLVSRREFLAYLYFIPRSRHSLPWHACDDYKKRLSLNKTQLFPLKSILQSFARCKNLSPFSFCHEPLHKLLLGSFKIKLRIFGQGIRDESPNWRCIGIVMPLEKSPSTQRMASPRHETCVV